MTSIRPKRVYIAGPMSGHEDFNYPAFNQAAATLRGFGYFVENPAENNLPANSEWADYMKKAIPQMLTCDMVILLKGWPRSKGANIEFNLAKDLGLEVIYFDDLVKQINDLMQRCRSYNHETINKNTRLL